MFSMLLNAYDYSNEKIWWEIREMALILEKYYRHHLWRWSETFLRLLPFLEIMPHTNAKAGKKPTGSYPFQHRNLFDFKQDMG